MASELVRDRSKNNSELRRLPTGRSWLDSLGAAPGVLHPVNDGNRRQHPDHPQNKRPAITPRTGAMRLNSAPMMISTSRSGRSMNPTLQEPINDSARARV